jgi:hypothetical protein
VEKGADCDESGHSAKEAKEAKEAEIHEEIKEHVN